MTPQMQTMKELERLQEGQGRVNSWTIFEREKKQLDMTDASHVVLYMIARRWDTRVLGKM